MSTKSTEQKGGSFSFLPMDLSGKLIIKARLGDDVRRVPIHNEDITYDEMLLMLQRVFRGKLRNTDDVTLKYCDEEGDLITVMDSSDLNVAKQISRLLKITIFIHGQEPLPILDASEVQEVRKELIAIRDKVNTLLDAIDGNPKVGKAAEAPPTASSAKVSSRMAVESTTAKPAEVEPNKPVASITMFDPLKSSAPSHVSSTDNPSTAHLFSQDSRAPGAPTDFLTKQQPSGYPPSSQPLQSPYSASLSPSAPQGQQQQQQPPPVPTQQPPVPTQQPPVPTQQPDSSYFASQQPQKSGYPQTQHYQTPPAAAGPSAPPTSSPAQYQQQTAYNQPGGYAAGAPPPQQQQQQQHPQQPGSYNYGFQTSHPHPSKPATAYTQQPGYAPYNAY